MKKLKNVSGVRQYNDCFGVIEPDEVFPLFRHKEELFNKTSSHTIGAIFEVVGEFPDEFVEQLNEFDDDPPIKVERVRIDDNSKSS